MDILKVVLCGLLILWGAFISYSAIFRMKKKDFSDDSRLGSSGYLEWEILSKLSNKLPHNIIKGTIIMMGATFMVLGSWMFQTL
ncbi:hypothetical protein SFC65_18965 [Priestia filamentosa]|uniref:hypothetical protein n=1 Tax=Priestia filamentosa TaxID=1402861 RepID=UPI003981C59A